MWDVGCLEISESHVIERSHDRLLKTARDYLETLSEDDAKDKVLEIMKTSKNKDFAGIDRETKLPKYFIYERLPGSRNIWVTLCIVEDDKKKIRRIKTLWTVSEERKPKEERKKKKSP